jgi:haloalkane dehalogenase
MNTWLHHDGYTYTKGLRDWNAGWQPEGFFGRNVPGTFTIGDFMLLPTRHAKPADLMAQVGQGTRIPTDTAGEAIRRGYDAPFAGLGYAGHAGVRRFPLSLPFDNPQGGNAAAQAAHFAALSAWTKPIHFIWGGGDDVFTEDWGRDWARRFAQASFDLLPDAGHFPQETRGAEIATIFLART